FRKTGRAARARFPIPRGAARAERHVDTGSQPVWSCLMSLVATRLHDRLRTRTARTGVVGLGYVGLPLLAELARSGFTAIGIDLDPRKVASINRGESYIPDVPSADLAALREQGRISATTDFSFVSSLDTINICVPTPLRKTKDPDLSYI